MRESKGFGFVKRTLGKIAAGRDKSDPGSSSTDGAASGERGVNRGPSRRGRANSRGKGRRTLPSGGSTHTLANSVYSEKLEDFSRALNGQPMDADKYPVLQMNDDLAVSIGDSFEANPCSHIESTAKFEYGSVRQPKTIRLLLIFPAAGPDDVLETIMFHADYKEVPFQALSHTCLDKARVQFMHCNGRALAVSESLYRALLDVRNVAEPDAFSIVWAEAVCIDQDDIRDREKHLSLVRDIFTSASVTLAHLGGTEDQAERAFETIDKLHEACKYDEFRDHLEQDEIDMTSLEHLSIGDTYLDIPPENRVEITRLFSHHWFERIWNWQDVGVSKKMCIMYGGSIRTWGYIADTAWCMYHLRWETSIGDDSLLPGHTRDELKHYHILHLDEHRDGALQGATFSLLSLLTESRHFTATNPLDRVFALYSHIGNPRERDIVEAFFDYSLPHLDVYTNVTLNCILSHRTLDVLHLAHNSTPVATAKGTTPNWPSFVPDLTARDNTRMLGSRDGRRTWEYQAGGETAPQLTILNHTGATREGIPWFSDDIHIQLKGLLVDEIAAVGTEMKGPTLGTHSFLADWVNTALMSGGAKFYTAPELKRAREMLMSTMKDHKINGGKNLDPSGLWVSRRTSMATRRLSGGSGATNGTHHHATGEAEPRSYLRSTFSPALIETLQKLDIDSDATTANGVDPVAQLPADATYPMWDIPLVEAFWRTLVRNRNEHGIEPSSDMGRTHFEPWFRAMAGNVSSMLEAMAHGQSEKGPRPEPLFNDLVHISCNGTRIARTRTGLIGTVPRAARPGDLICVLYGGQTPFVLRKDPASVDGSKDTDLYRLVGDCYVHGIMHGEALNMDLKETKFELY